MAGSLVLATPAPKSNFATRTAPTQTLSNHIGLADTGRLRRVSFIRHLPRTSRHATTFTSNTNRLISADGRLNTSVGIYSDCSGQSAIPSNAAAIDTCMRNVTYFVGHNVGVFTPLFAEHAGSIVTWYDGSGAAHQLRIVATRSWMRISGQPPKANSNVIAQFQTCITPDGSVDLILDAVAA